MTEYDLASALMRETYRPTSKTNLSDAEYLRRKLDQAKCFVLDESMSEFLGVLSIAPFNGAKEKRPETLESMRHGALLPFKTMFIQWDGWAHRRGMHKGSEGQVRDVRGKALITDEEELIKHMGVLLSSENIMIDNTEVTLVEVREVICDEDGTPSVMPFVWLYTPQDWDLSKANIKRGDGNPVENFNTLSAMFGHGVSGYHSKFFGLLYDKPFERLPIELKVPFEGPGGEKGLVHSLVVETGGIVRTILSFLVALNNAPVKMRDVKQSDRKYYARGQFRRFKDHSVITLNLPARIKNHAAYAKRLVATGIKLPHHDVRAHWRQYRDGNEGCAHTWSVVDATGHSNCIVCDARRVWVVLPKGRGSHDVIAKTTYRVKHKAV